MPFLENSMELSIVIPAYNEEKRIKNTLYRIINYFEYKEFKYEIIVVNDGSTDNTVNIVKGVKNKKIKVLTNNPNMGKGYAVKRGVLAAKKKHILFSDADLSTPIEEIEKFLPYLHNYDVLIGSRNLKESDIQVKQPFIRSKLGKSFPFLVRCLLLKNIKDTQCGFKLFQKHTIKPIFEKQTLNGFSFDGEILYIAQKLNYKIKEIPITWINSLGSKVNTLKDSYKMFKDLFKIRENNKNGLYKNK